MERESTPARVYSSKITPVVQAISSTPTSPTISLYVLFEGPVGHLELTSLLTKERKKSRTKGVFFFFLMPLPQDHRTPLLLL